MAVIPTETSAKAVQFVLVSPPGRLPLRVQLHPHDSPDNIVTTVRNFFGVYNEGVAFKDEHQNILIIGYERFHDNMTVYVEANHAHVQMAAPVPPSGAPQVAHQGSTSLASQHLLWPTSGASKRLSPSPGPAAGWRSASVGATVGKKARSRSSKNPASSFDSHSEVNGYASGDGAPASASSKTNEHIGNTDISLENIVQGGRRKRAKFESSELPLFAPPQMPAATSNASVSPARRMDYHRPSLPFTHPGQNPFSTAQPPLHSPQGYRNGEMPGGYNMWSTPVTEPRHHHRDSLSYTADAIPGVLPTPDPTIGSRMSDEDKDVALQLMRLGDMSNMSHGRTSASTMDDTLSGKAEAASSTGSPGQNESDSDDGLPRAKSRKMDMTLVNRNLYNTTEARFVAPRQSVEVDHEDAAYEAGAENGASDGQKKSQGTGKPRLPALKTGNKSSKSASKMPKPAAGGVKGNKKSAVVHNGPMSPTSLPAQSRKPSVASTLAMTGHAGDDEHPDLSTKPRCQRCRKSKKGCDRQRPCGRCRDAGLSADQCISEDEGNGRKGRYGRHMGVPLKQIEAPGQPAPLLPAPVMGMPMAALGDKNKKRKR